ncbi:rhomboid family intramembrane serine protease [Candidatus Sumerlaeota bacterium]|nr:rhomboid family intramembrane serine protease [Candidatus Sumerlaeota bacterium]
MMDLPPKLEKFLQSIGVNTNRLKWKLYYLDQWWERQKDKWGGKKEKKKYKHCKCGQLCLANDKACVVCGRKLPSYAMYRIYRLFALQTPQFSIVTTLFLFLIVLLYGLQAVLYGAATLMTPTREALLRFGALTGDLFQQGEYFRIMTMALVHIGILHILFNTMAMSQILPLFEDQIGSWSTLTLITITQITAGMAHLMFYNPVIVTAGASGVAFGLIGFGVTYFRRSGNRAASGFFLKWFMYAMVFGFLVCANHAAHLGGFISGLPLGYILGGKTPGRIGRKIWMAAGVTSLVIWIIAIGWLIRANFMLNVQQ